MKIIIEILEEFLKIHTVVTNSNGDVWEGNPCKCERCEKIRRSISTLKIYEIAEDMLKRDQLELAKEVCLLQPCEILQDEATGQCYACKIGSSIKKAYDLCQPILAKQILKVEALEAEIKDRADTEQSLTNWVDKLGTENDKLKEQQLTKKELVKVIDWALEQPPTGEDITTAEEIAIAIIIAKKVKKGAERK